MESKDERIASAIRQTEVLRPPKRALATFGTTNIHYYLVTEPAYAELVGDARDTVVREGRVIAERPRVVTPSYLGQLEGFSEHAQRYLEAMVRQHGPHAPGLLYSYRNEARGLTIVADNLAAVVQRLNERIDREGSPLSTIIKGLDELWDVSLLKFIYEVTSFSLGENILELGRSGLLDIDHSGVPREARQHIEGLFTQVERGALEPRELKAELERWGLWSEYEDRFLAIFRRRIF